MTWLGKRVELQNKKTGEKRLGVIVEDGPAQTVFLSDDGEKLLASDWYYRPAQAPRAPSEKKGAKKQ